MKFHIYNDHKGEWRWRLKAANGQIVADSAEGYSNKQDCLHGINLVRDTTQKTPVVEED